MIEDGPFKGFEVVNTYTRAEAIADGTLVDVSDTARKMGFKFPVALSAAVWHDVAQWTDYDDAKQGGAGQSTEGRLRDLLLMGFQAIKRAPRGGGLSRLEFSMLRVPRDGQSAKPTLVEHLILHCGPGDNLEPVLTIMFPDDD